MQNIWAIDYLYKKTDDFKTLNDSETVEAFESSFEATFKTVLTILMEAQVDLLA